MIQLIDLSYFESLYLASHMYLCTYSVFLTTFLRVYLTFTLYVIIFF